MNTVKVPNNSDPDEAGHLVGPDLDLNSLQMLSAEVTSRQRINDMHSWLLKKKLNLMGQKTSCDVCIFHSYVFLLVLNS